MHNVSDAAEYKSQARLKSVDLGLKNRKSVNGGKSQDANISSRYRRIQCCN